MTLAERKQTNRQATNVTLKDYKGFGISKSGNVRKGFFRLNDGRIISLKKLKEAIKVKRPELQDLNVVDPETLNQEQK